MQHSILMTSPHNATARRSPWFGNAPASNNESDSQKNARLSWLQFYNQRHFTMPQWTIPQQWAQYYDPRRFTMPQFTMPQWTPPNLSQQDMLTIAQVGSEFLPMLAPQLSAASPLLSVGYAGQDIYRTAYTTYAAAKDLSPAERFKRVFIKTGDVTLFHVLATFLLPLALLKPVNYYVNQYVKHHRVPKSIQKHPKLVSISILTSIALVTAKPVNQLVNLLLDWTYRPWLEGKDPRKRNTSTAKTN